jgi:hypothetical protein
LSDRDRDGDCALGLRFTGDRLPGLIAGIEDDLPRVTVERATEPELEERWGAAAAPELIFARTYADGRPFLDIERDEAAGYRVWADGYGTHLIAPDGTRCASAFPEEPAWRGLRLLSAQAMPLMTALRGREVMHAAGVVVGESLVGLVAASGTGKSATAANLMAQGGRFFADDVLPLDVVEGRVIAHPGGRIVNVHQRDLEAIAEDRRGNIGVPMGQTDKLHLEPEGFPGALPLAALVFLERRPDTLETTLDPLEDVPRRLLGNAFLPYLVLPERLARQLEVAAALEQSVRLMRLQVAPGDDPSAVAARITEWVKALG